MSNFQYYPCAYLLFVDQNQRYFRMLCTNCVSCICPMHLPSKLQVRSIYLQLQFWAICKCYWEDGHEFWRLGNWISTWGILAHPHHVLVCSEQKQWQYPAQPKKVKGRCSFCVSTLHDGCLARGMLSWADVQSTKCTKGIWELSYFPKTWRELIEEGEGLQRCWYFCA